MSSPVSSNSALSSLEESARQSPGAETTPLLAELRVKVFADAADLDSLRRLSRDPLIRGFTTNPTLMRRAGVENYERFARAVLDEIDDRPVSFEVFSDDLKEMGRQARIIAGWAENAVVKIPVINSRGESAAPLIRALSGEGVALNVTAVFTPRQVLTVADALHHEARAIISIFAGRIADTGRDPVPFMRMAGEILFTRPNVELLWASPREALNVFQADACGCHIITATPDLLSKLALYGRDLEAFSRETVEMFHRDARESGFRIDGAEADAEIAA